MYRAFLIFHRWLALCAAILVFAVAITGAATAFEGPIRDATAMRVEHGAARLSLDSLAAIAKAGGATVTAILINGEVSDSPTQFLLRQGSTARAILLNPYTGAVVEAPKAPSRIPLVASRMHRWHTTLTGGKVGKYLVTIATLSSLVLALTGLVLWWRQKIWRVATSASWKRINFDLHHVLGLLASIAILIMTATGAWMLFEPAITPLVLKLDHSPQIPVPAVAPHTADAKAVSFDSLARIASAAMQGAALMNMQVAPAGVVRIQLRYPEDHTPAGRSFVYVDPFAGGLLRVESTRTAELGTKLLKMQRSLHTGDVLGAPTQIIWFLAALTLASQAVTGVLMWWNARAARRAASR